jgi:hypothetical protein
LIDDDVVVVDVAAEVDLEGVAEVVVGDGAEAGSDDEVLSGFDVDVSFFSFNVALLDLPKLGPVYKTFYNCKL